MNYSPISNSGDDENVSDEGSIGLPVPNEVWGRDISTNEMSWCDTMEAEYIQMNNFIDQANVLRSEVVRIEENVTRFNLGIEDHNQIDIVNLVEEYSLIYELTQRANELMEQANDMHRRLFGVNRMVGKLLNSSFKPSRVSRPPAFP